MTKPGAHLLRNSRSLTLALICWVGLLLAPIVAAQSMRVDTVTVTTAKGSFRFQTEIAETDQQRQTGLMFRQTLPPDRAMLFDWGKPIVASMWMQNTHVSLDMVFITQSGAVVFVAENTKPMSRDIVTAGRKVRGVLEVVAGTARRIGLKPGDKVIHPIFSVE